MPSQVFQESVTLEVDVLEAVMLDSKSPEYRKAYPFPGLIKAGRKERIELPVIVLENDFLSASVAPSLGGRILNILDKRSGVWLFEPYPSLAMSEGGPRGVQYEAGIRWSPLAERLNDLGPVDFQIIEPDSEDDPAGVWLAELVGGSPVSVHLGISLSPDEAALRIEMRSFNRSFRFVEFSPNISSLVPAGAVTLSSDVGAAFLDQVSGAGLYVQVEKAAPGHLAMRPSSSRVHGSFAIAKFEKGLLAPRQLDTWSIRLMPLPPMEDLHALGDGLAIWVSETTIGVTVSRVFEGAKMVIRTESGEVAEATLDLDPDANTVLPMGDLGMPKAVAILDNQRNELVRWPDPLTNEDLAEALWHEETAARFEDVASRALRGEDRKRDLENFGTNLGYRAAALSLLGIAEMRAANFFQASSLFEDALSYNADDHLTWWMLAAAKRHAGDEGERAEILNAHYLAPLEPLLRGESFMQDVSHESPSLLAPMKDDPDALIEVASYLFDLRLFGDLSRWVRAALAQREVPMLRSLLAAALLEGSGMKAEAAHELALAAKTPVTPPYPWRETEGRVLEILTKSFPGEKRVFELVAMYESALSSESHRKDFSLRSKEVASVHPLPTSPSKRRRVRE